MLNSLNMFAFATKQDIFYAIKLQETRKYES